MAAVTSEVPGTVLGRGHSAAGTSRIRTGVAGPAVRLTRRGRMAVTGVSALLVGVLSVALAASAQAGHRGSAAQPDTAAQPDASVQRSAATQGRYVARVLVQPGQSLWVLAQTYDPHADPRQVVAQIQQLNSMSGVQASAGQLLWVPRG
jgi:hypothetical protein